MTRNYDKKNYGIVNLVILILIVGIAVIGYGFTFTMGNQNDTQIITGDITTRDPSSVVETDTPSTLLSIDKLNSPNAILLSLDNNTILMEKNSEEIIYPASLTKIMTAIVAIENIIDLNEEIQLSNEMFHELYEADASMAGFKPGEMVSASDLLYGAMLPSGAESCLGLAIQIAGSEAAFVELMNQKAVELGMNNSHFENTTGLHDENHYTTVKDIAILLSNALQNDTFLEIFTSHRYSVQATNKHQSGMTFNSTMFEKLKQRSQSITDGEILGGKTGYTDEAGLCLASFARVGNKEYILITAGANGDHYSEQYNITDAFVVYNTLIK